ncbi:MAG: tetratricopeptide repeat protein [Pyrinomonadaceae bacterium]
MSFDKIKAMRNAERFLAQGKIRAAINEYKRVVESDPKDFSTLNMLGDLHAKAGDKVEAVNCFTQVAEHYGKQGFAQKAIAIYNKISRLTHESLEISEKLAQLYQSKGSIAEARSHYTNIAEQYQRKGKKAEALGIWKQIADLDKTNTEIYLKIAEAYWQDSQEDEAANAFIESGKRLSAKHQEESAAAAFSRALEIRPNDLQALNGYVQSHISLGFTGEAAQALEKVLEKEPYNREVIHLLIDCYLDTNNPAEAEKTIIKLVEKEPANYPKFLNVVELYLKNGDLDSAARILSMTAENLLVGGQAAELEKRVNEILAQSPDQLAALRLLVRFHGWQRDESALKQSLERMLEAACLNESPDDERYALLQLVMIAPQESAYAGRLHELNELLGTSPVDFENPLPPDDAQEFENSAGEISHHGDYVQPAAVQNAYGEFPTAEVYTNGSGAVKDFEFSGSAIISPEISDCIQDSTFVYSVDGGELSAFEQSRLQQELESIDYYISQNYLDLALKSLEVLEGEFGNRPEIENVRQTLAVGKSNQTTFENRSTEVSIDSNTVSKPETNPVNNAAGAEDFHKFKNELDLEDSEMAEEEGDYETHYHLGIAYKEMGLMDDSIREFQDAVKLVHADDGTRRFLLCCNLLGHCFMEKAMPNLALIWYERCLETANLNAAEQQGLHYEIANAYETGGDANKAIEYFEKIYASDVEYRNVAKRLKNLRKKQKSEQN